MVGWLLLFSGSCGFSLFRLCSLDSGGSLFRCLSLK